MSSFTKPILLIFNNKGSSAITTEEFKYYLGAKNSNRYIVIPDKFPTDGNSLPPFAEILRIFVPRWSYMKASLVHDALCVHYHINSKTQDGYEYSELINQRQVDLIFKEALEVLGAGKILVFIRYHTVRTFQILKAAWMELTSFLTGSK